MKVGFVVAYFGRLPSYFQLFLESCRNNRGFDWLIFTDDLTKYAYPENVRRIPMDFSTCRGIAQDHFDFPIALSSPKKLCDYKCAYGYIFQEYLREYDWWGHCDLDQIFGDLSKFITSDMLEKYDKIGSLGHLTLYRNEAANNLVFEEPLEGKERYKEVFSSDRGFAFDEWLPGNVNEIFLAGGRPVMLENMGADINAYRTTFQLVNYDLHHRRYVSDFVKTSIFHWRNGRLFQLYLKDGELQSREFSYVHLQKRKMKDQRSDPGSESFYIVPNRFVDAESDPRALLRQTRIFEVFNYQYVQVKAQSLKYRLRSGDWKRENVFRQ